MVLNSYDIIINRKEVYRNADINRLKELIKQN